MASSAEEIKAHLKIYYMVFGALAVLTVVTVAVARLEVSIGMAVAIAMFIACIKGSLVACYFMHLISERGMIFWILIICVLFFFFLLLLPVITQFEPAHSGLVEAV